MTTIFAAAEFLLPIVYQLTLDAALKFHGKSQIPA
jgi:hypothetical protein